MYIKNAIAVIIAIDNDEKIRLITVKRTLVIGLKNCKIERQ